LYGSEAQIRQKIKPAATSEDQKSTKVATESSFCEWEISNEAQPKNGVACKKSVLVFSIF